MDNKENIDSKENIFRYSNEVHLGESSKPIVRPQPVAATGSLKIKKVDNVIPLFIECEKDGVESTVFAYMNYATNTLKVPDETFFSSEEEIKLFKDAVINYLMNRHHGFDPPQVPQAITDEVKQRQNDVESRVNYTDFFGGEEDAG
jgi:hypothetical protein